jgi:dUTP pyrophosphatase
MSKEVKEIIIKYFSEDILPLEYIDGKSDWIDLRAAKDMVIKAGEKALIPLGVAMQLPEGYEAIIAPRSSTFKTWEVLQTNSIGVIDETYCGNNDQWMMPVYATKDTEIKFNDRVCQFRIIEHQPKINFVQVESLEGKDRGGFGSTGAN